MSIHLRRIIPAVFVMVLAGASSALAQDDLPYILKYTSGQGVQPIFEGWSRNPDGSFEMHFGYLNRNFVEELHVPVGPDNRVEPQGPDRGQPTYFYTRINRHLFSVTVPADWGRQEVVWTVTVRGKSEKAVGWLQPEWEIDPIGGARNGGRFTEERSRNKPPALAVEPVGPVSLAAALRLVASVTDDGLPEVGLRRGGGNGRQTPPTLQGGVEAPINVPDLQDDTRGEFRQNAVRGLAVSWMVWRGPAGVSFEPGTIAVRDGKAVATATFKEPGTYILRAVATDTMLSVSRDVEVTVRATPSTP